MDCWANIVAAKLSGTPTSNIDFIPNHRIVAFFASLRFYQ
jgi:hypothetical protein